MTISLKIRNLKIIKHQSFKYAIFNLYIFDRKDKQDVIVHIRCEIYLVDNLKTNILIDNDIIELESIIINIKKREIYIDNCDVTTYVKIQFFKFIIRSIHLRKTIIISLYTKISLVVYYFKVSNNRNFLFEFENNVILIFYVSIINVFTKTIIAHNDIDKLIQISRNY